MDRINKFPLVLSFATTHFSTFTLIALINPAAVAEMFRTPFVQSAFLLVGVLLGNATLAVVRFARESRVARASIPVL